MSEFSAASKRFKEARALHDTVAVADGHNDLPWAIRCMEPVGAWKRFSTNHGCLHTDVPRLREGGIGWQFWSVYVPATVSGPVAVQQTLEQIDFVHRIIEKYSDTFELATCADDVDRIFASGRIACMCGMEGGHQIHNSMGTLRMMYRLGCRYMTLTHNGGPAWADCAVSPEGVFLKDAPVNGLTEYGRDIVKEMNRIGMLVDLSHVHHVTMKAAIETSKAPVIFSHSSSRALCSHPRDVPDDILQMLPANGGVIMVTFVASFVAGQFWVKDGKVGATVNEVADHIDHIRDVCGIESIGIGGDYDGCTDLARGGYSDDDLRKILGGNIARALRAAEKYAKNCTDLPSERLYEEGA
eukprot:GSChrysophyteH2.ASY1.ANO1.1221.1 assembled CDS